MGIHAASFERTTGKPYYWYVYNGRYNLRYTRKLSQEGTDWGPWGL